MTKTNAAPAPDFPAAHGHNRPPGPEPDDFVEAFTNILTMPRSANLPSHIETAFEKARIYRGCGQANPDPLLIDLFGFEEGYLPRVTNLFCADMGTLLEKLVKCAFSMMRSDIVDTDPATMAAEAKRYSAKVKNKGRNKKKYPEWKNADFFLGKSIIVEAKYRFNSYDSKTKQINVATAYRMLEYTPVFLHLSSEFQHREDFLAAGWEVYTGQEAIRYINDHTGMDFVDILRQVAAQPVVHDRIEAGRRKMIEDMKLEAESEFKYGLQEVQDHILSLMAEDEPILRRFAEDHIAKRPNPILTHDAIIDHAEALSDAAFADIGRESVEAAIGALDMADKKELIVQVMSNMGEEDKLDILSRS